MCPASPTSFKLESLSTVSRGGLSYQILSRFTADQLVFADESSKDKCTLQRNYGRGPAGERAVEVLSFARGVRYSVLPAKDFSLDSPRLLMRSETTKVGRLLLC
ncbi:hypothetical protein C2E23DRAFT_195228 [Lenzites betulinus]|nr:hypothetical protein C2E23DRAFT_195228 [Lenzites betulinus]